MIKKIILGSILSIAFYAADAQVYHVEISGAGANGSALVRQTTTQSGTTITCTGSGYDKCEYTAPPSVPSSQVQKVNSGISHANTQVNNGNLSGQFSINGVSVNWSGFDAFNYNVNVIIAP